MYEVGSWFVYLMDAAILALVVLGALIAIFVKRGKYQREAAECIQGEILLSTGQSEWHTVKCGVSDKWVKIDAFEYKLDLKHRRWGVHPRLPFLGLKSLQVPIRKETWKKDNPNPFFRDDDTPEVTSAEIDAKTREASAIAAAVEATEMEARDKALRMAIQNQPAKMIVYIGLAGLVIFDIILIVLIQRMGI